MMLLSSHMINSIKVSESQDNPSASHNADICLIASLCLNILLRRDWIIDSGASKHMCFDATKFSSLKPDQNSMIRLPNNIILLESFCGDIKINSNCFLRKYFMYHSLKSI